MSSTPRFFVPPGALRATEVTLPPDDAHHARTVLRLRAGEAAQVCTGDGIVHECTLTDVSADAVVARVDRSSRSQAEPETRVTIAQALPKNEDKLEQVLQHGTEIGAAGFYVFTAARSVARPDDARIRKRGERWRGIVKAAAQQSGRAVIPPIAWGAADPATGAWPDFDAVFVAHEAATNPLAHTLSALPPSATRLLVLVGPEGGFTDGEIDRFTAAGAAAVSLGPRILRTETAALVALAQILFAREAAGDRPGL